MNVDPSLTYHQWQSDIFGCPSNDIDHFYRLLAEQVRRFSLTEQVLGTTAAGPVSLYQPSRVNEALPSVLISCGFHGEEAAGPWGLLHFLSQQTADLWPRLNLSLLPLVNPTGFSRGFRLNDQGENPNRGFSSPISAVDVPSIEGQWLLAQQSLLTAVSKAGLLTCHEDVLLNHCYIYAYERGEQPGPLSCEIRDTLTEFFGQIADGDVDGCQVTEGIIFNHFDSSFEAYLAATGTSIAICSETPGQQNFDHRVLANSAAMAAFVRLSMSPVAPR